MYRKILLLTSTLALLTAQLPASQAQERPSYYPSDYGQIVQAAKSEAPLLIYTNLSPDIWDKVNAGFATLYPGVKIQTVDLGPELFERYNAEHASSARTADLIVTSASENWKEFVAGGHLLDYKSAEADKLPDWASPAQGLYTVTADPMLIVYNKFLVPAAEVPGSIKDIAALLEKKPQLRQKVTTYNIVTPFALALNWAFLEHNKASQSLLEKIGASAKPERSAGPMFEKIGTGEYALGYFVSSATTFSRLQDPTRAAVIGWKFISDGNPLVLRGAGIPKDARSINSAKLMLDYLVSVDGQKALGKGGVTPYRKEVKKADVAAYTYDAIAEAVGGEGNLLLIGYDKPYLSNASFMTEMRRMYPNAN